MARVSQRVNYYNFSGGKVSDTNPLTPPENVARKLINVDIMKDGTVVRRLGLEPEYEHSPVVSRDLQEVLTQGIDISTWKDADFDSELNFVVVRVEDSLLIYKPGAYNISNHKVFELDISKYRTDVPGSDISNSFQTASGKGLLVCSGASYNPFYIKYDSATETWTDRPIHIRIRDFEGVDDGFRIDERRASNHQNIPPKHLYNLLNQGWSSSEIGTFHYENERYGNGGIWPANGDNPALGRVHDGKYAYFQPNLVTNRPAPNGRAPNGRFIIDPFDTNTRSVEASRYAPAINVGGKVTLKRPKSVAFYAGRFFYGSVDGTVFYSQIIESEDDLGKCYQQNDPTAEDAHEILATDGGTLKIMSIGTVEKLVPMGSGLVALGSSGIYYISGGVDTGFTASNQQVAFVSNVPTLGYRSIVQTNGPVLLWTDRGIYVIDTDDLGAPRIQSVSENRIGKDYDKIPVVAKLQASGCFNPSDNKVYWFYNSRQDTVIDYAKNHYTDVLILDLNTGAFWDYQLSQTGFENLRTTPYPFVVGGFTIPSKVVNHTVETVTDNTGEVVTSEGGDDVYTERFQYSTSNLQLTVGMLYPVGEGNYDFCFARFTNRSFKDWEGLELSEEDIPGDYTSEVETLPMTLGEPSIKKQTPYLYTYYQAGREYPVRDDPAGGGGDGGTPDPIDIVSPTMMERVERAAGDAGYLEEYPETDWLPYPPSQVPVRGASGKLTGCGQPERNSYGVGYWVRRLHFNEATNVWEFTLTDTVVEVPVPIPLKETPWSAGQPPACVFYDRDDPNNKEIYEEWDEAWMWYEVYGNLNFIFGDWRQQGVMSGSILSRPKYLEVGITPVHIGGESGIYGSAPDLQSFRIRLRGNKPYLTTPFQEGFPSATPSGGTFNFVFDIDWRSEDDRIESLHLYTRPGAGSLGFEDYIRYPGNRYQGLGAYDVYVNSMKLFFKDPRT